jgi:hypothetical protein
MHIAGYDLANEAGSPVNDDVEVLIRHIFFQSRGAPKGPWMMV